MGDFSIGGAVGAGFGLIGRHPLAVLVWMAAYLAIGVAPQFAMMALVAPGWAHMMQQIAAAGANGTPLPPAEMMRAQFGMMQLQPVAWLVGIASQSVLMGAVYRAVLDPDDRRFFYLRLGARELWIGLAYLVLIVMAGLLAFAIFLPVGIAGGILGVLARDTPALALIIVLLVLVGLGLFFWVLLRLSLATPISFQERAFRLYESWSLTRGHAGKIFLVGLTLAIVIWIVEMVLVGIGAAALSGAFGLQRIVDWMRHPQFDLAVAMPWLAGGAVLLAAFSTLLHVLFGAAWAEIYRGLAAEEPI